MIRSLWKTILLLACPLPFFRLYGGGGDGGAGQMRQDEQARQQKVQQAIDAINAKFGVGTAQPTQADIVASVGAAPTREQFTSAGGYSDVGGETGQRIWAPGGFDQGAYSAAMQDYQARLAEAQGQAQGHAVDVSANKAARDAQYTDIASAVRDQALRDLDQQYTRASNTNTFGLARSGLLGGSVDAESGADLKRRYGEGEMKAQQAGLGAASDLRAQDEKTRQNLISLAQSGLDTGTASSMAEAQMGAAAQSAKSAAAGASVGRLFDDMSQAYVTNQLLRTRYGNMNQQQPTGYGGPNLYGKSYTGTVQN